MSACGRLVVLEGGEFAGKSTQARLLADRSGALLTREPGGTWLGERVRSMLLDGAAGAVAPRTELLLVLAARAQHVVEVLRPALAEGRDVVCDRFSGSTLAYQGYGRGLPLAEVASACEFASDGIVPDLTVLLDVDPDRAAERGVAADRIERAGGAFHARIRDGFRELARMPGWVIVDGNGTEAAVAAAVAAAAEGVLGAIPARTER